MLPEKMTKNHQIDTIDIGSYAQVGMLAVDVNNEPVDGSRYLIMSQVKGDHTATLNVGNKMALAINFQTTAEIAFHITLYEVC